MRPYQRGLFSSWTGIDKGGVKVPTKNRLIEIAHRRWGKDEIALRATLIKSQQRPASYWHCLPEYNQGRKALWTAVNPHTGKRRIEEAFPPETIKRMDDQQMFIEFKWGSTWQIVGSDRYDSLVGAGVAGVVFSEWALANPGAWGYIRPMVQENDGWAAFITTPRGNNHAKAMLDMAEKNDSWFSEVSTVHDTGALTQAQLDEALAEYQAVYGIDFGRAMFEQEYLCSFAGAMVGAYFGAEMSRAEREGRIKSVPIDHDYPVHCVMDLGKASNNPVWLFQVIQGKLKVVDFYKPDSEDLDDWCDALRDKGFDGNTYVPHDIMVTEWGTKKTRFDRLTEKKMNPRRVARVSVADGLQAGRMAINEAEFDVEACELGIDGLKAYRREWDDDLKTFRETPVKDWAEHIGSAWRYLGLAWKEVTPFKPKEKPKGALEYNVLPDGSVKGNMSVKEAVDAMVRRRRMQNG